MKSVLVIFGILATVIAQPECPADASEVLILGGGMTGVSLDSRPIKIRPGTYCRGDSAHALQITQNMGNRTTNVKP